MNCDKKFLGCLPLDCCGYSLGLLHFGISITSLVLYLNNAKLIDVNYWILLGAFVFWAFHLISSILLLIGTKKVCEISAKVFEKLKNSHFSSANQLLSSRSSYFIRLFSHSSQLLPLTVCLRRKLSIRARTTAHKRATRPNGKTKFDATRWSRLRSWKLRASSTLWSWWAHRWCAFVVFIFCRASVRCTISLRISAGSIRDCQCWEMWLMGLLRMASPANRR